MGTKIKDAALLESVTGAESIPVSDGTGTPKRVQFNTLKTLFAGGGGIPIVDSEEKLETLNLPQGSLASVASVAIARSFRELYQPPAEMMEDIQSIDKYLVLCSSVNSIEFSFPTGLQEGVQCSITLMPRGFSIESNTKMIAIQFSIADGHISSVSIFGMGVNLSGSLCSYDSNGVPSIEEELINALNNELKTDDWCYAGGLGGVATEEHLQTFDKFAIPIAGVDKTEAFVKNIQQWDRLAKPQEGYPVVNATYSEEEIAINPNTYYKIEMSSSPLNISFNDPVKPNLTNEYVVEIKCSGKSVSFPETVKWVGGTTPAFNDGEIIVVSIVNNLALFAQFFE